MTGRPHESGVRQALCRVGRALYDRGLIAGTAGNMSVRLDERCILVTPRGARKDRLEPGELVRVDLTDPAAETLAIATTEWPVHRACYAADESVSAALHTHAPALTAAGLRRLELSAALPELETAVGPIHRVDPAASGSAELGQAVGRAVESGARVILLQGHGAFSVGTTLEGAFDRMELAELAARAVLLASGPPPERPPPNPDPPTHL